MTVPETIAKLRALMVNAPKLPTIRDFQSNEDHLYECPTCGGDGQIHESDVLESRTTATGEDLDCNITGFQVYGIGGDHLALEELVRTALLNLPQLLTALEARESDRQQKAVDIGFKYWRASDAHGIKGTKEQAESFIADLVGVEVEILMPTIKARESEKPKKTDEDLVEMMAQAVWNGSMPTKYKDIADSTKENVRSQMRTALAVVRGEMK